ncbi:DUF2057 domain-containing protein [Aliivibrio fischeri]|uniref:UPF0319 protein VFMJ11_1730 n=1 Tax=Aliivibrio fischeri (strain MJ11) TaxID=388396 RepID=Y1730_ALIFM|nr:DUF2057 family protein [Aliivibrio fischeri]B5FF49.1 RecName: Full=UPF0319 protein VFMJ11_1730; Flags: Precursor [Aliivibrio fischeri MJ11]ACH66526.1 protein VV2_0960 [Aliivibrio fischeri MJ11]MCE4937338.1 DUF2057 family protein [Aliivibrio fischeri]MUJ21332.1 DUF2057 domain-containing protein [Aliivibrio fischeri]MUK36756.1 DUF2057 domain-containing protein [Aliivibrio fischeri]MUL03153.1 DUF2057 domain-containing protein [Aliivibrio fischeri]
MKIQSIFAASFCLLSSISAHAAIQLTVPDEVELILVDNQEVKLESSFFSTTSTLDLENGKHQIVFRYNPVFKQGKDNIIVSSDIIVSTFSAEDKEISFKFPTYNSPEKAKAFNRDLNWELIDKNNNSIPFAQSQLIYNGMQVGRNIQFEVAKFNTTEHPAAFKEGMLTVTHKEIKNEQGENTAEQMLHYWYEKADQATKERFLKSITNK